jgi:hypothetical protein
MHQKSALFYFFILTVGNVLKYSHCYKKYSFVCVGVQETEVSGTVAIFDSLVG